MLLNVVHATDLCRGTCKASERVGDEQLRYGRRRRIAATSMRRETTTSLDIGGKKGPHPVAD